MFSETNNTGIENILKKLLEKEGYKVRNKRGLFKLGTDIKATKNNENWYIEVAKSEESSLERVKDFYEVFFRSISRLNNNDCKHCVIAIPENLKKFLHIRARIYKVAWKRIAEAFPELEIWIVDAENKKYQKTPWIYWLTRSIGF